MINPQINIYDTLLNGIQPEHANDIRLVMYKFIINEFSYDKAIAELRRYSSSTDPIDKLQKLMCVSEHPLPSKRYPSQNYMEKKMNLWSQAEDQRLLAAIHRFGPKDWTQISLFVGKNRNRNQCSQRWLRSLNPLINKTSWSQDEDLQLLDSVSKYGLRSWTKVSLEMEGRTDVQCRYRYQILMRKNQGNIAKYKQNLEQHLQSQQGQSNKDDNPKEIQIIDDNNINDDRQIKIDDSRIDNLMDMIKEMVSDPSSVFNFVD